MKTSFLCYLWYILFFYDYSTPLHFAAAGGFLNIVKLLVDHNASIDIEDNNGNNAYVIATYYGSEAVANYLENV